MVNRRVGSVAGGVACLVLIGLPDAAVGQHKVYNFGQPPGGPDVVITGGGRLYATSRGNNLIYRRDGNGVWSKIGLPNKHFAVDGQGTLFAGGDFGVFQYTGNGERWDRIGEKVAGLYAGGTKLYAIEPGTNNVVEYRGRPNEWAKIGLPNRVFAVDGRGTLYAAGDYGTFRYSGTPERWDRVGEFKVNGLKASRETVYARLNATTAKVFRLAPQAANWEDIGIGSYDFEVSGNDIVMAQGRGPLGPNDPLTELGPAEGSLFVAPGRWERVTNTGRVVAGGTDTIFFITPRGDIHGYQR